MRNDAGAARLEPSRAVVISGVGAVTALGTGWGLTRERIAIGRTALQEGAVFLPEVPGLRAAAWNDPGAFEREFPELQPPFPVRETKMVLVAARQALRDAALDTQPPRDDIGVMLDRTWGPGNAVMRLLEGVLASGPRKTSPVLFAQSVPNAATGNVVRRLGVRGPHLVTMGGGAAALASLALRAGDASAVLTGGFAELHPERIQAEAMLAQDRAEPTPLREHGEGAVVLVLERADSAALRSHPPRARLAGIAVGVAASSSAAGPPLGDCVREALERAALVPTDVAGVVGSASRADCPLKSEREALRLAGLGDVLPFTLKPLLGETLGMAAAASIAWAASTARAPLLVLDVQADGALLAAVVVPT